MNQPIDILNFWSQAGPSKWWKKDAEFDAEIKSRFGETYRQATQGQLDDWSKTPDGTLALIILLDQFSRNLFRNSPDAFAQDSKALAIAKTGIEAGFDKSHPDDLTPFFYMPFMHCENLEEQKTCLRLMQEMDAQDNVRAAKEHLEIIEKYGRFPHRNTVLGRASKPEEIAFLEAGGFSG